MSEDYEAVTGGCLCGAVRYEARALLGEAFYCHCTLCRRATGAPADISVFVEPGSLVFTKAKPKYHRSSPFGSRGFCPECGGRLTFTPLSEAQAHWLSVTVGSLDEPERAVPISHGCVETRLPWYDANADLPATRSDEDPEVVAAWAAVEQDGA